MIMVQQLSWSTGQPVNQHFSQSSIAAVLTHQQASKQVSITPFPSILLLSSLIYALFCFSAISSSSILQDNSFLPSLLLKVNHSNLLFLQDISFFPSLLLTFFLSSYISIPLSTTFHIVIKNMHSCLSCRIYASPNHFTIHLHTVSTPLFISLINHLPYYHSHASLFTSLVIIHIYS